jgi:hypothetical protein
MVNNLYPRFLDDPEEYRLSELFWLDLWSEIDPFHRESLGWTHPWLGTGSPQIKDGNPIFSAYSPILGRAVRVIQEEPATSTLDIQVWLDTFGGDITDPDRIHELVVWCALSDVASKVARSLISPWVRGRSLSFRYDKTGLLLPDDSDKPSRNIRSIAVAA